MDIIQEVKKLRLPIGEYAIFGSSILQIYGIRPSNDIDIIVTPFLYEKLKNNGWNESLASSGSAYLTSDNIEAYKDWKCGDYQPKISDLIKQSILIDKIPFVPIQEVLKWKTAYGRPKDLDDVSRIKSYLKSIADPTPNTNTQNNHS